MLSLQLRDRFWGSGSLVQIFEPIHGTEWEMMKSMVHNLLKAPRNINAVFFTADMTRKPNLENNDLIVRCIQTEMHFLKQKMF